MITGLGLKQSRETLTGAHGRSENEVKSIEAVAG